MKAERSDRSSSQMEHPDLEEAKKPLHDGAVDIPMPEKGWRPFPNSSLPPLTVGRVASWTCLTATVLAILAFAGGIIAIGVVYSRTLPHETIVVLPPATRYYYLAVEEIQWEFTPGHEDVIYGPLAGKYVSHVADPLDLAGSLIKGHFVAYTDGNFTEKVELGPEWDHLGLIGPPIHAEAGDTIQIMLRNRVGVPVNLEPMGMPWNIQGLLGPINSGLTASFQLEIPLDAGPPASSYQSSRLYFYRSALNPTRHENSGFVGPLIVTRKGDANPDGTPKGVDREIVSIFQIYNERETEFAVFNAKNVTENNWTDTRYTINGHSYGTSTGFEMNVGETVRWYVGGLGTENGMHNFHWHGHILQMDGHHLDQMTAIPATTVTADMKPDNPGVWLYHCHVNSHLTNGMVTTYKVNGPMPPPTTGGIVRTYYIQADEVEWNYAPQEGDACTQDGSVQEFNDEALTYLGEPEPESLKIGSIYTKALFREYTDDTFTELKPRSEEDEYLGFLGPLIRAQVGDTIVIHFRNALSEFPASLHPHGVLYNKSSEGAPYVDGSEDDSYDRADDAVPPGGNHTYIWEVPDRAGPGPTDPSSILWMYHSHADETMDTWAGMMGAIIVTKAGQEIREDGSPTDVDVEKVLFYSAIDESQSLYATYNMEKYLSLSTEEAEALLEDEDEDFMASSLHRSLNGFMYCNMPRLTFQAGSRIRIHLMALGDIGDMHTPGMGRGGGFLNMGQREDAVQLSAGSMYSVDVVMTETGNWTLGCNVLEHEAGGIKAMYEVLPSEVSTKYEPGTVHTYYLQAEEYYWNYAPKGYIMCTNVNASIGADVFLKRTNVSIGSGMFHKARYTQYTDATFTTRVPQPDYLGTFGPFMVLETGDTLKVVLKNSASFPINFSPGGGLVTTGHNSNDGLVVQPGATFTYEWRVPKEAGPTDAGLSSVAYPYSSTVDHWVQSLLGLEGMLVVVHKGDLGGVPKGNRKDVGDWPVPKDVDLMIPLLWQVFDENVSPYMEENMRSAGLDVDAIDQKDDAFVESNIKHTINGFMYCNLPIIQIPVGSKVRWVMMSVGATEGLHAPVLTKFTMETQTGPKGATQLMPGYTASQDMIANYTGLYPMWCNVHDHVEAGMSGQFNIY